MFIYFYNNNCDNNDNNHDNNINDNNNDNNNNDNNNKRNLILYNNKACEHRKIDAFPTGLIPFDSKYLTEIYTFCR